MGFRQDHYKSRPTTENDAIFLAALLTLLFSKVYPFMTEIIKIYYQNLESVASTLRSLRPIYGRNNRSSRSTIERLMEKFESTGIVQNFPVPVRQRSDPSVENVVAAETSVEESPNVSLTRRFQALGISVTSL